MPRFEEGDRVKIVKRGSAHESWEGELGTVVAVVGQNVEVNMDVLEGTRAFTTVLGWPEYCLELIQTAHQFTVSVLGEDYFA